MNENLLVKNLEDLKVYTISGDMMDNYNQIHFEKKDNRIFVKVEGGDFEEPYIWNFDLRLIDMLGDSSVIIDKLDGDTQKYFYHLDLDTLTLEQLKEVENSLSFFVTKFSELPRFLKHFIELPNSNQ